ncbi:MULTISPECIES: hypothetical protein [Haloferax]|jgi:uncharacterized membrane protein|uniref:hypothetical protein n=1 Tax=Haloferax TaxID=2251 RepID=UPI000E22A77D|nr:MULTISPECIES: hypothetical protein [Haloferax]RDZ39070.1 hypothetical protein C5B89_11060 [Haloferax sp. Atlit-47N]WEL26895.1 hypothetical protein SVXHx_2611 [Haloferax lucentense]WEL30119.1 hypothetical protein HBNXHx_2018 [Haloferax alexandrinus]
MPDRSSNPDSLKSRLLFFVAGLLVAVLLFTLDVGGTWSVPAGILAFVLLGEAYLSLTGERPSGR